MKTKSKVLIIATFALLMMTVLVPAYALGNQSGTMQHDRDQTCEQQGPSKRTCGEDPPVQTQEEKPEELSEEEVLEEAETPIQDQTQTMQQLRDCNCENEECEQNQYQYQYKRGQEE